MERTRFDNILLSTKRNGMVKVREALHDVYGNEPYDCSCDGWYRRFVKCFLEAGIPEEGVAGIIRAHPISLGMVKRYGRTSGLIPEIVAQNILNHRHDVVIYDDLAKPKVRVTSKKIRDFSIALEKELRRIWRDPASLEGYIQDYCYDEPDTKIAKMIAGGTKPEIWAENIRDYL